MSPMHRAIVVCVARLLARAFFVHRERGQLV